MAAKKKLKASKKTTKRKSSKRTNTKHILAALVRQPLGKLVKRSALIDVAIDIKRQKQAMRKGSFIGPLRPSAAQKSIMSKAAKLSREATRLANLAKARIARQMQKGTFVGPVNDPQARAQFQVLRDAGVPGF
jgi:hypothetical protein